MRWQDEPVSVVIPNRYEANLVAEIFRNAATTRIRVHTDAEAGFAQLNDETSAVVVVAYEAVGFDGLAWVRVLRRMDKSRSRKAAIFVLSRALTASVAERCRHAGANAVIGMPLSSSVLLGTITKVFARPRPFVEADGYVGPRRRAGIVTAGKGAGLARRRSDPSSNDEAA